MTGLIDPALNPLLAEQRAFIATLGGRHMPPPPAERPNLLPSEERELPGTPPVKIRILRPEGALRGVYLHFHAGGFVRGNAAMNDVGNSRLAENLSVASVSVDYRLADGTLTYRDCLADCVAAAQWLIANAQSEFGTSRLIIGGQSAGATLAVLTLLKLREMGMATSSFAAANLTVGCYDFSGTPSQRAATAEMFLSPDAQAETRNAAFPGKAPEELRDPAISSLYADLSSLPPAIFTVGTADAVVDDGMFMAARWEAAGNEAELHVYPEAPHLFLSYPTAMSREANSRITVFLARALA